MLFPEKDAPALKTWIVNRLETPSRTDSDVDADVLADYVLALLRHDGDANTVRQLCVTELYDFLKDEARPFINDVFRAIVHESYRPGAPPLRPLHSPVLARKPDAIKADPLPTATSTAPPVAAPWYGYPGPPAAGQGNGDSRKRSLDNSALYKADVDELAPDPSARVAKQARRGGSFRGGRGGAQGVLPNSLPTIAPGYPTGSGAFGAPPPEEIARLQQQMGLSAPMYGGGGGLGAPGTGKLPKSKRRCRTLARSGECPRPHCPFDHSENMGLVDTGAFMAFPPAGMFPFFPPMSAGFLGAPPPPQQPSTKRPRRSDRSHVSAEGPVLDQTRSTIVVEGIPAEYLSKEEVDNYFAQFGVIDSIRLDVPRKLAIVKYASWAEANAAYQSPKAVFDNRFVKVYWHKDDGDANAAAAEPEFDMDEFYKKQQEAQRAYEDKMQKKKELDQQREALNEQLRELLAKQAKERQKLVTMMAMAAAKAKRRQGGGGNGNGNGGSSRAESDDESSGGGGGGADKRASDATPTQTDLIRAQLAALEEEARMLGLDPDAILGSDDAAAAMVDGHATTTSAAAAVAAAAAAAAWPARGRGGFVRGGRGRGRGGSSSSVAGRGRNASVYAAYSLDNRPRRVAVSGVDFTAPDKDEALRQYLLGIGDYSAIETTDDAATITFADRRTAEQFYHSLPLANKGTGKPSQRTIPGIATPVNVQWVANTVGMATGGSMSAGQNGSSSSNSNKNGNGNGNGNGHASDSGAFMINTMDDDDDDDDGDSDDDNNRNYQDREDGRQADDGDHRQQNMDFDVAGDEGGWDIA